MAFSAGAAKQKTQSWDNLPPELQKVMAEHKNMAAFSSTIVQFEQQRQSELMRARQKHQASLQGPATLPARQRPAKTVCTCCIHLRASFWGEGGSTKPRTDSSEVGHRCAIIIGGVLARGHAPGIFF